MTKKELAKILRFAINAEQLQALTLENLISVLEETLGAIATIDPAAALEIIEDMATKKPMLAAAAKEREENDEIYISTRAAALPDSLEFEEEPEAH